MTSARRRPTAAGGATVWISRGGERLATTLPVGVADWRSGGATGLGDSDVAGFGGMIVDGGIASPAAGVPDGAGGVAPAFAFGAAGAALRSAVSSMARRSRAVA